jgi:predicted deacylase
LVENPLQRGERRSEVAAEQEGEQPAHHPAGHQPGEGAFQSGKGVLGICVHGLIHTVDAHPASNLFSHFRRHIFWSAAPRGKFFCFFFSKKEDSSSPEQEPKTMATAGAEAEIDFDTPGVRTGYVRLGHSDDRNAFSVIPVPVAVLASARPGPTMFLSGGNHGDEYEGQAVLHRLLRQTDPASLRGRLIVLPALNLPAVRAGRRVSPLDGGNMNRVFPGDVPGEPSHGPTWAMAAWVTEQVLSRAAFACDLHSGGSSGRYVPCAYLHWGGDAAFRRCKIAAAAAFGAPYTVIAATTGARGSMTAECDRRGIIMVATEFGGGASLDLPTTELARDCLQRLLRHAGIVDAAPDAPAAPTRFLKLLGGNSAPMAEVPGLFEPARRMGETVAAGELAGVIWPVTALGAPGVEVRFPVGGLIVVERVHPMVEPGDLLFRMAEEIDPESMI